MARPTRTYLLMRTDPEAAVALIADAYEKHGNWAEAAKALGVSVATLRIHARKLGFAPGGQHFGRGAQPLAEEQRLVMGQQRKPRGRSA